MLRNLPAFDQPRRFGCAAPKDMQQTNDRTPHSPGQAPPPPSAPGATGTGQAPLLLALAVFVLTLLVTLAAYTSAQRNAEAQLREAFDYRTRDMSYSIGRRLAVYEQVLRGARGYLRGSLDVSRADFGQYYRQLRLDQSFPGLQALGIASALNPGEVAAHEARVRAEGFPGYRVLPAGARPLVTAISHIEPFTGRNLRAFGFDMYSEPVRRAAMAAARDSGQAALSGKVVLVQEGRDGTESGFLMYLPLYRAGAPVATLEQRRAALLGWVYAPFRMADLMRGVGGLAASQLDVTVYDGEDATPDALLYQTETANDSSRHQARLRASTRMLIAGRSWTVSMASSPALEATYDGARPRLIAAAGIVLGLLVSLVVWLLAGSRRRALQLAHAMTFELRESHDRIAADSRRTRVILETAYDGFIALDRHGRITDWNAQASRIFGLSAEAAIGRQGELLVPEELRAAFRATFEAFAHSGAGPLLDGPTETEALHADGRRVPVELAVARLPSGDGAGVTVFVRDITARRDAEAREGQRQSRLDEARAALNRAQKLEAVGKLTGGVAHDFNNILHIIGANVQLMLRNEETGRKRLVSIMDAVERGRKLVAQLLAFARRQPLHPSVVNLAHMVERMDTLLHRAAGDAIEIRFDMPPGLWNALVDPNQLENVLLNLVINARDAMDGQGSITIALANLAVEPSDTLADTGIRPGEFVSVAVSDTGSGMPPEVMERAFEPFFTTKPEGKGTGLGLAGAHGFAKQSGGHIRLASTLGEGTTVTLYLPRALQDTPDPAFMPVHH